MVVLTVELLDTPAHPTVEGAAHGGDGGIEGTAADPAAAELLDAAAHPTAGAAMELLDAAADPAAAGARTRTAKKNMSRFDSNFPFSLTTVSVSHCIT